MFHLMVYYICATVARVDSSVNGAEGKGSEVMAGKQCDTGLDDRCRDRDGEIRQKRGDTLVGTLRKTYGSTLCLGSAATCVWTRCANVRAFHSRKF
jgi:hypothetical protein